MAEPSRDEAAGSFDPDLESELTCSICTDILFQPLTLLDCLHTFCGGCLKEWFAWQAAAAAQNRHREHPYTCPSCRESVRSTKADFKAKGWVEAYLKTHPGRGKTEEEKAEARKHYKPGDDVLPRVPPPADHDSDDERLLSHVRDLSMASVDPAAASRVDRERQRRRAQNQAAQHRPDELARNQQPSTWVARRAQEQQEVDGRHVEHQPSLRSLLSGSDLNAEAIHQEILQSLNSDGWLDGIDTDNLTPEQEEELIDRIAEAYQRRHRQRERERSRNRERREGTHQTRAQQPSTTARNDSPDRRHARAGAESAATPAQTPPSQRARPPISRPHLFEQAAPENTRHHQRSTSHTSQNGDRTEQRAEPSLPPAARSATDLSQTPSSQDTRRTRHRTSSGNTRSSTDPASMQDSVQRVRNASSGLRPQSNHASPRARSSDAHPAEAARRQASGPVNTSSASLPIPAQEGNSPRPTAVRPVPSNAALAPEVVLPAAVPSVSCSRCSKQDIGTQVHYHCPQCRDGNFNLCVTCYRNDNGCDHWFGFGFVAVHRWERAAPPEGWPSAYEHPHILSARRYVTSEVQTPGLDPVRGAPPSDQSMTLQEGAFCETCFSYADDFYWYCQDCLEGAWGYCHACVLQGRHCTHPLLPLAHHSLVPPGLGIDASHKLAYVPAPHLKPRSYVILPSASLVDCDICRLPIPPRGLRFHCYRCSDGDYDVCNECYHRLVATGKIGQADGPHGWRRCLQRHRMAVVAYQDTPYRGGQVRLTLRPPVGGWRLKEATEGVAPQQQQQQQQQQPPPSDETLGERCLAVYHRFPPDADREDLLFPKNAEIRECEDMNEDWAIGVYAGEVGVFPRNHTQKVGRHR